MDKYTISISLLMLLFLSSLIPFVSAAPSVSIIKINDIETTPETKVTVNITAKNVGTKARSSSIIIEKESLPENVSIEKPPGSKPISAGGAAKYTAILDIGKVKPGNYTITLYDLTTSDPKTYTTFTLKINPKKTPEPTETPKPSPSTPTHTHTQTQTPSPTTKTPNSTPGLSALLALTSLILALKIKNA